MDQQQELRYLRTAHAVRERCALLYDYVRRGDSPHLELREDRLEEAVALVHELRERDYPTGAIPYHSRWRHFDVGGVERISALRDTLAGRSAEEQGRAKFDLAIVSVLLDAGAGERWRYQESAGGEFGRSEGLAVASYHLLRGGALSTSASSFVADAEVLAALPEAVLAESFRVTPENPLAGFDGRVRLLQKLGERVAAEPRYFCGLGRPGGLFDYLHSKAQGRELRAGVILETLLNALAPIWPGRARIGDETLGDAWFHPEAGARVGGSGLVPFHKLSQWLAYSLIEPLEESGLRITGLNDLTGLPEYRNGGLFLDTGALVLRDPRSADVAHAPESELVVEWRACTVLLLDAVVQELRRRWGMSEEELPVARALQCGTWTAGREIARRKRAGGTPPLNIASDGTVF